jgi:ATP-dependent DNA helicase RecQ
MMRAVLAGEDLLTLLPTGAGKSRTFQLPAMIRPGLTLVISPLIALIRDQVEKLREVPGMTAAAALVSGMDAGSQEDVLRDAVAGKVKLLYVSPERLRDPRFQAVLPRLPLVQLVIDEAHCISTWGHDFRPDFLEIARLLTQRRRADRLPVHALTATATPRVQEEIKDRLEMGKDGHEVVTLSGDFVRKNLVYRVYRVPKAQERDALAVGIVHQLVSDGERGGAGVVYVATRRQAEQFATLLRHRNIAAQPYHAGLDTPVRHQIQERFMQGDLDVVVATNAFGMGVDKSDIRFVLHYDHPQSLEAYAQESGRAGRDGREAYAILLSHPQTQKTLRFIYKKGMPDHGTLQDYRRALSTADVALANAARLSDGTLLCDPDDVAALAGLDPTQARLLLFSFQEAGLVQRGDDCTMEASLLLNQDVDVILAHLDGSDRGLAQTLFAHVGATRDHQVMYHAVGFSRITGCDPRAVDPLLVRLAGQELLLYRPFKRGMTFQLEPALQDNRALDRIVQRFADRYDAFNERLGAMLDYISLHGGTPCRSAYIVNYLTGRNDAPRCGICDLCSPTSEHLPWDPGVRLYGEPLRVDPYLAILGAVRDHDGWFGRGTIEKMLLGVPVRIVNGERVPLSQAARSSDHFGDLKDSGCSDAAVRGALSALIEGGYLQLIDRRRRDGESYSAIGMTQKGRDALAGGVPLPGAGSPEAA